MAMYLDLGLNIRALLQEALDHSKLVANRRCVQRAAACSGADPCAPTGVGCRQMVIGHGKGVRVPGKQHADHPRVDGAMRR
jgi:hypothetical protein